MNTEEFLQQADLFLSDETKDFTPSTQASYGYVLRRLSKWMEDHGKEFDKLTLADANAWLNEMGWQENLQYAGSVVVRSFAVWRSGRSHPMARFRLRKPGFAPQRTLTIEQAKKLISFLEQGNKIVDRRNLAMIALLLDTGLRAGEICRLQINRIDMENRDLRVLGKGRKWRSAVFSPRTKKYLEAWLEAREKLGGIKSPGHVFISVNGKTRGRYMTPAGLRPIFRTIAKAAGMKTFTPHDLRRSMATIGIQSGAPSRLIQKQGGWASLDLVERYTASLNPHDVDQYLPIETMNTAPGADIYPVQPDESQPQEEKARQQHIAELVKLLQQMPADQVMQVTLVHVSATA